MRKSTIIECGVVLGNARESDGTRDGANNDRIHLHWHECLRRTLRKQSLRGTDVVILQPPGQILRHGDLLVANGDLKFVIEVMEVEVIVARPGSAMDLATLAFEIGNLHIPVEIGESELYVIADGPIEELLERYEIRWTIQQRRFAPIFPPTRVTVAWAPQIIPTSA